VRARTRSAASTVKYCGSRGILEGGLMKKQIKRTLHQFTPRRTPRQRRSQIVFDKILATAKTLFQQDGYAYVSTNKIAEKANISIGTLYQYFANCESIALAVYEDSCAKAASIMKRKTSDSLGCPLDASIPKLIEGVFETFEKDRYALLQLISEVPALRHASQPLSYDRLIHRTTQMFIDHHLTDIDPTTVARKSYVINSCVTGVISRYLDERPDILNKKEVVAEITELVRNYIMTLSRHRHGARARPPSARIDSN
jgi:AcrR family transcriptional regulator